MEDLNCRSVHESLGEGGDRAAIEAHLSICRECQQDRAEVRSLTAGLRSLPQKVISPLLETRLRVIASRERSRHILKRNLSTRAANFFSRVKLHFDNLLRPLKVFPTQTLNLGRAKASKSPEAKNRQRVFVSMA